MDLAHFSEIGHTRVWWFTAKDELVKSFFSAGDEVLDVGANVSEGFYDFRQSIVLDRDRKSLKAVKNVLRVNADVSSLPFKSGSLENILMSEVLEHTRDDKPVLAELRRVLSCGGKLVVTVPAFGFIFSPCDEMLGHFRRYDKAELLNLLEGFEVTYSTYWNFFLSAPAIFLKLAKKALNRRTYDASAKNRVLDAILLRILRLENLIISRGISLPFGLSLVVEAEKTCEENV